jgi:hypothetical protein
MSTPPCAGFDVAHAVLLLEYKWTCARTICREMRPQSWLGVAANRSESASRLKCRPTNHATNSALLLLKVRRYQERDLPAVGNEEVCAVREERHESGRNGGM